MLVVSEKISLHARQRMSFMSYFVCSVFLDPKDLDRVNCSHAIPHIATTIATRMRIQMNSAVLMYFLMVNLLK